MVKIRSPDIYSLNLEGFQETPSRPEKSKRRMKTNYRFTVLFGVAVLVMFGLLLIRTEIHIANSFSEDNSIHGPHGPVLQRRFLNKEGAKASGESVHTLMPTVLPKEVEKAYSDIFKVISASTKPPPPPTTTTTTTTESPDESLNSRELMARDNFTDLWKYSLWNPKFRLFMDPPHYVLPKENPTLQELLGVYPKPPLQNWQKFQLNIRRLELYQENDPVVEAMLHDIATRKIVAVEQYPGGTQIKLAITFDNGGKALFKPMRFPRDRETLPNHFYFNDFERHHSEIATYHLDRLLGFRRAPPVIGRRINISSEVYALADSDLRKTFYMSPENNTCFFGTCKLYCDDRHAICGSPDMVEGSFAAFLPPREKMQSQKIRSPWRRSYSYHPADWIQLTYDYCGEVKKQPPYNSGRRLYDLMDMATLDFLTGNMDRHHYEDPYVFGNHSMFIHWDNGRGFGKTKHDEITCLYPILQCCVYRLSTFNRLYEFHNGPVKLSELMRKSMAKDPLAPILTEAHLKALDRRVGLTLAALRTCLKDSAASDIFLDDLPDNVTLH